MITSIEEMTVNFCDNGFMLQFSYTDEVDRYKNKRMVFATKQEVYAYIDTLLEARNKHANSSL